MLVNRKVYLDIEAKFPDLSRKASNGRGNWFSTSEADLKKEAKESLDILADVRIPEASRIQEVQKKLHAGYLRSRTNSSLSMGEDVVFCIRAAAAGHQPFVDLGLLCGHMGNKIYSHKS
jgi:hypothetical protein